MMSKRMMGLGAATGLLLVGAAVVFVLTTDSTPRESQGPLTARPRLLSDRCPRGEAVTVGQARDRVSFQILMPDHSLAREENLISTTACPADEDEGPRAWAVSFVFESGIKVTLAPNDLKDPARTWSELAAAHPENTSVGRVRGAIAWLAEPYEAHGAVGAVEFVENGVKVAIIGNGEIPLGDLVAVAESLNPRSSRQ